MNPRLRSRYLALSASIAVTFLLALATPAAAAKIQIARPSSVDSPPPRTIDIQGLDTAVVINQFFGSTLRFGSGTVHVRHGGTIVLTNHSNDGHSFTLVDPALLPKTVNDIFNCFGGICGAVAGAHFPGGLPPGLPASCLPIGQYPCIQFIDNGQPSAVPPSLDTPWTLSTGGDSVVILPGAAPIAMTVTAKPGTYHFMCVVHPWMQGAFIVDGGDDSQSS
jgi:hypothetical protein